MPATSDIGCPAQNPSIRLRAGQFAALTKAFGWVSDADAARAVGVDAATIWRVRTGATAPGTRFVAGLLLAARPYWRFDDLFEVCMDEAGES